MLPYTVGQTASFSRTITETDLVIYAGLSGDYNPIHVDSEYAKQTRFQKRIAHGLLTTSLISRLLGMHLPGVGSVYLEQSLKFLRPVFIGDTITTNGEIIEIIKDKRIIKLKTICLNQNNVVVLEGVATMLVPKEGGTI